MSKSSLLVVVILFRLAVDGYYDSIEARERVTRHDVKARIDEFCALAGHEQIHKGMTSRDLTENVEQLQIRRSLVLVRGRMLAALARLAERAAESATLVMAGRTPSGLGFAADSTLGVTQVQTL